MLRDTKGPNRRSILKALGLTSIAATLGTVKGDHYGGSSSDKETMLVGISAARSMAEVQSDVESTLPDDAEVVRRNETLGYMEVEVPDRASVQAQSAMENQPGVEYTEESKQWEILEVPNDSLYEEQYAPQQVNAPTAWDTTLGSDDVTVAVVDQGVLYDHPDLADRFGANKGRDFVDGDDDPQPDSLRSEYHGTHVAGIAAGTTDNGEGISGISNSTILSGRALSEQGRGSTADIADAVQWAADQGADIVNLSLGGGGYSETMKNAVSYAVQNGTLPIAASGNDSSNTVGYPAAYNEVVAVSAVDSNEQIADFSNTGDAIDVTAPGVNVLSTWSNDSDQRSQEYPGRYAAISGTSMACPAASGVAALGLAADPSLSPTELRERLKSTAVDIGLPSTEQGAGRVDAANIVSVGEQPPSVDIVGDETRTVPVDTEVTFEASAFDPDGGEIVSYEWSFGDESTGSGSTVTNTYTSDGEYTASVTVTDDEGQTTTESVTVIVESDVETQPPAVDIVGEQERTVPVDTEVTFEASASDPDGGDIVSYDWSFGDGSGASGSTVTNTYTSEGEYTAAVEVTDDDNETSTASVTVIVEPDDSGGTQRSSAEGSLYGYYDSDSYSYPPQFSQTSQITVSLSGPADADFDLYVTYDGRTPSTYDYDERSITQDSQEQVIIDQQETDFSGEIGILVDSYSGSGSYVIEVEELGR